MSRPNTHLITSTPCFDALSKLQNEKLRQFIQTHPEMGDVMTLDTYNIYTYVEASQEFQKKFGPDSDYMAGDYNCHHQIITENGLTDSHLRSIFWRLYLGCFDLTPSTQHWPHVIQSQRRHFDFLTRQYALPLAENGNIRGPGVNDDNITEFIALGGTIKLDLTRTYPSCGFFTHSEVQQMLLNVLYIWCIEHEEGYKQGMNELAAVLLVAVAYDALDTRNQQERLRQQISKHSEFLQSTSQSPLSSSLSSSSSSNRSNIADINAIDVYFNTGNINPTNLQEKVELVEYSFSLLVDQNYIIHDTYTLFCAIMKNMGQFYSITAAANAQKQMISPSGQSIQYFNNANQKTENSSQSTTTTPATKKLNLSSRSGVSAANNPVNNGSESEPPIVLISHHIFHQLLPQYDPDLYRHLNNIDVIPTLFLLRWVRLLFSREYNIDESAILHDVLFTTAANNFSLLPYLAIAMLHLKRTDLLEQEDTAGAFEFLLRPAQNDWWSDDEEEEEEEEEGGEGEEAEEYNSMMIIQEQEDDGYGASGDDNGIIQTINNDDDDSDEKSQSLLSSSTTTSAATKTTSNIHQHLFDSDPTVGIDNSLFGDDTDVISTPYKSKIMTENIETASTTVDNEIDFDSLLVSPQRHRGSAVSSSETPSNQIDNSANTPISTPLSSSSTNSRSTTTQKQPKQKKERPISICKRPEISSFPQRVIALALQLQKKITQLPKTGKGFTSQQLDKIQKHHSNMAKMPSQQHHSTPNSKGLSYSGTDYDRAQFGKGGSAKKAPRGDGGGLFGFVSKLVESTPKRTNDKVTTPKSSNNKRDSVVIDSSASVNRGTQFEQQSNVYHDPGQQEQITQLINQLAGDLDSILAPYQEQILFLNTLSAKESDTKVNDGENETSSTAQTLDQSSPPPLSTEPSIPQTQLLPTPDPDSVTVTIKLSQLVQLQQQLQSLQVSINSMVQSSQIGSLLLSPTDDYFSTRMMMKNNKNDLGGMNIYQRTTYNAGGGNGPSSTTSDSTAIASSESHFASQTRNTSNTIGGARVGQGNGKINQIGGNQPQNDKFFETNGYNPTRSPNSNALFNNDLGFDGIDLAGVVVNPMITIPKKSVHNNTKINQNNLNNLATINTNNLNDTTIISQSQTPTISPLSAPTNQTITPMSTTALNAATTATNKATAAAISAKSTPLTSPTIISSSQIAAMSLFDDNDSVGDIFYTGAGNGSANSSVDSIATSIDANSSTSSTTPTDTITQQSKEQSRVEIQPEVIQKEIEKPVQEIQYSKPVPNHKGLLFEDDDDDDIGDDVFATAVLKSSKPLPTSTQEEQPQPPPQQPQQQQSTPLPSTTITPQSSISISSPTPAPSQKANKSKGLFDDDPDDIFAKSKVKNDDFSSLFD